MRTLIQRFIALVLLAVVAWMVYYLVVVVGGNTKEFTHCERWILQMANEDLEKMGMEPLVAVSVPGASRLFGVPEVVNFNGNVSSSRGAANRAIAGTLEGKFDRAEHIIHGRIQLQTAGNDEFTHHMEDIEAYCQELELATALGEG